MRRDLLAMPAVLVRYAGELSTLSLALVHGSIAETVRPPAPHRTPHPEWEPTGRRRASLDRLGDHLGGFATLEADPTGDAAAPHYARAASRDPQGQRTRPDVARRATPHPLHATIDATEGPRCP